MNKAKTRPLALLMLIPPAILIWAPLCMLVCGVVTPTSEIARQLSGVLGASEEVTAWSILSQRVTFKHIVQLLLDTPEFYRVFWNSCLQVLPGVAGQVFVGAPAAWALARYRFPGKRALNWLYILLMILPFQVTMVSGYIVLNALELLDTPFAIILPTAFSAFPVFIMSKFFSRIPVSLLEAARMDGAGEWRAFASLGLPLGLPGILSAALLGFVEGWNAVEQPLTFLKTKALYPLSIFLPETTVQNAGVSFAAALITLTPAVLVFFMGQSHLEQGIIASGLKE